MARAISETMSMFMRNIVLSRMSRIITVGSCMPVRLRGAGGAMTVVVRIFMNRASYIGLTTGAAPDGGGTRSRENFA